MATEAGASRRPEGRLRGPQQRQGLCMSQNESPGPLPLTPQTWSCTCTCTFTHPPVACALHRPPPSPGAERRGRCRRGGQEARGGGEARGAGGQGGEAVLQDHGDGEPGSVCVYVWILCVCVERGGRGGRGARARDEGAWGACVPAWGRGFARMACWARGGAGRGGAGRCAQWGAAHSAQTGASRRGGVCTAPLRGAACLPLTLPPHTHPPRPTRDKPHPAPSCTRTQLCSLAPAPRQDNGVGMAHKDIPEMLGRVLSGTK